jgi:hypothetical protein
MQALWIVICGAGMRVIWRFSTRHYSAVGN